MADVFLGQKLVVLYTAAFSNSADELVPNVSEVEEGEDSGVEERRMKVVNDPYWRALMSDDENDAWDVPNESEDSDSYFVEEGGDSGVEEGGDCEECGDDGGHEEAARQDTTHVGGLGNPSRLLDDEEEDEVSSDLARSDVLVSLPKSDEEFEATSGVQCVTRVSQFEDVDMEDPHLDVGMSFDSAAQFRKAVREYNLFTKNDGDRVIRVCRNNAKGCPWRVYGSLVLGEMTFILKSLNPDHRCTRCYKSLIVTSRWIADKMFHKFKIQPNYPFASLNNDVKRKWNVDVSFRQLYKAKVKALEFIEGKHKEQYKRLMDYCATVRQTNRSTMLMKVERPTLDVPPTFLRLYMSLAVCKDGFRKACRPVIGVDGCFLKRRYGGQLLGEIPMTTFIPLPWLWL
jgi:hypothetical protein